MRARPGVALVMVLWIIIILGTISAGVVRSARTSTAIAANARAGVMARAAAESGIEAIASAIEDTLTFFSDAAARRDWLNTLGTTATSDSFILGDARFAVVVVDVGARLDINAATESALQVFFSQFTGPGEAAAIATSIRRRVDPRTGSPGVQSVTVTPLRSLDELRGVIPGEVLERAAPYMTVDGDGAINARTASDTVLVAASGELRDEPSRLLLVSRGWASGVPLTTEIQAVYAVVGNRLVFSHWRERSL